jgi:hypothetical protein
MKSSSPVPGGGHRNEARRTEINNHSNEDMKRIVTILLGLVGAFLGLGIALPALAVLKSHGSISSCGLLFLGLVMVTAGIGGAVYGIVRRNAQAASTDLAARANR